MDYKNCDHIEQEEGSLLYRDYTQYRAGTVTGPAHTRPDYITLSESRMQRRSKHQIAVKTNCYGVIDEINC